MLPERLRQRCPSACLVGVAIAHNFVLQFSKASKDGSGKAALVESPAQTVPGVIFEIETSERAALDRAEGHGHGYERDNDFTVEILANGDRVSTCTYIATTTGDLLRPFDWYLALVIVGALHQKLDEQHIAALHHINYITDSELNRPTRLCAIEAMQAHGIKDYRAILRAQKPYHL